MEFEERLVGQIRIWHNLNFKKGRTKGLKCKNESSKQKNEFLSWPNMALTKPGFKTNFGLKLGGEKP